jgi:hypothetical protein
MKLITINVSVCSSKKTRTFGYAGGLVLAEHFADADVEIIERKTAACQWGFCRHGWMR